MVLDEEELRFGRFALCPRARALLADGVPVELGARAFDLLAALVRSNGTLLTKDALMAQAWPGAIVEENNLHVQIGAIRRALGDDRDAVITVPGRGYRFGLKLREPGGGSADGRVSPPGAPSRLSLVVLPFQAIGPEAGTLADGVTDSLTTDLSRALPGGTVVSRSSAGAYGGQAMTARRIGEALGTRYLLEGSVAVQGTRVRVNAQLIAAETDLHLWAERFDQPRDDDLLRTQDLVVARLVRLVSLQVVFAEAQRGGAPPDAEALALRAKSVAVAARMSAEAVAEARLLYAQALLLDGTCVEAAAGLASMEAYAVVNGLTPPEERAARLAEAGRLAAQALAAQPGHLCALQARAVVLRARGQFADAIAAAESVLARCPGDPPACREIGLSRLYLGEAEAAIAWFRQADQSGPGDPVRWTWLQGLGRALLHAGRPEEAVPVLRTLTGCHPGWPFGHALLALALDAVGEAEGAREHMVEFRRHAPSAEGRGQARLVPVPAGRQDPAYHARDTALFARLAVLDAQV